MRLRPRNGARAGALRASQPPGRGAAKRAAAAPGSGTPGRGVEVRVGVKERAGRGGGWLGSAAEADMKSDGAGAKWEGGVRTLWERAVETEGGV